MKPVDRICQKVVKFDHYIEFGNIKDYKGTQPSDICATQIWFGKLFWIYHNIEMFYHVFDKVFI